MDINKISSGFPPQIVVPDELVKLCQWQEENRNKISGLFRLRADHYSTLKYWFGHDRVVDRFGIFGACADGSPFAFWKQDDGRQVIVYMGSEGDPHMVLATNFLDFLRLLAIGYQEIGHSDLAAPPNSEGVNPIFRQWVESTFNVSIPAVGTEITRSSQATSQDFQSWIKSVL